MYAMRIQIKSTGSKIISTRKPKTNWSPSIRNFTSLLIASISLVFSTTSWGQTPVRADSLSSLKITVNQSVPAQALSLRVSTVASQLTSTISQLPLLVGETVATHQLGARLDCQDNELALKQSHSDLAALSANKVLAGQQLERLLKLRKSNNASEEEINQKQAELNVVNAQISSQNIAIKIAQRQVEKCEIRMPFKGVITEVHSEVGNFVTPGSAIATVVDTENIELNARINPDELKQLKENSLIFLYQEKSYPVEIRATLGVVNSLTQNQNIRLRFVENKPLSGANGRLQWTLSGSILPASLVVTRDNMKGIFIVDETPEGQSIARFFPVAGAKPGQPVSIDLDETTLIVTDGRFALKDSEAISY